MASISKSGDGSRKIQFLNDQRCRKTIYLGKVSQKMAEGIKTRIEQLAAAVITKQPVDDTTSRWLAEIDGVLYDKLAIAGLVKKRGIARLAAFVDDYIESRTDAKPNTVRNLKMIRKQLVEHFGENRDMREIKSGDCDEWRQSLVQEKYSEATISKWVKQARHFFKLAVRKGLVQANPFQDLKAGSQRNETRLHFVDRPTIDKVLKAAKCSEWKLIIALARYGGLRTPSETLELKWADIDWKANRITVTSPKTEHQHKPYRIVPLFPELRPYLEAAFKEAPEGAIYCIRKYRDVTQNIRSQFFQLLRHAKVHPWPRLFQNLRASRQTELADQFPLHVVTQWIGNSPQVASQHYLKTTEDHFQKAIAGSAVFSDKPSIMVDRARSSRTTKESGILQRSTEPKVVESSRKHYPCQLKKALFCELFASSCVYCTFEPVPPRGIEPRFTA